MNRLLLALKAEKSNVDIHKHSAFQVVFTEDMPFLTTIENKKHNEIFGFAIKPQVAHSCECNQSNLIILNIEPYSFLGKYISTKLEQSNFSIFTNKKEFEHFFETTEAEFSISILVSDKYNQNAQPLDERVLKAILFINENFRLENNSIQDIAKQVFLSPSRLTTLFKQQMGSSITKYLLWTRLRNAIFSILTEKDKTLTTIALENGFYDSSQMIKYMYHMFGISPSKLKQKSDLIQFLETESQ